MHIVKHSVNNKIINKINVLEARWISRAEIKMELYCREIRQLLRLKKNKNLK